MTRPAEEGSEGALAAAKEAPALLWGCPAMMQKPTLQTQRTSDVLTLHIDYALSHVCADATRCCIWQKTMLKPWVVLHTPLLCIATVAWWLCLHKAPTGTFTPAGKTCHCDDSYGTHVHQDKVSSKAGVSSRTAKPNHLRREL